LIAVAAHRVVAAGQKHDGGGQIHIFLGHDGADSGLELQAAVAPGFLVALAQRIRLSQRP
jgi:hypothetical protein